MIGHYNKLVLAIIWYFKENTRDKKGLNVNIVYFSKIFGVTHQTFKPSLVYRHTRIPIYKKLSKPILSHGSESYRIARTDKRSHISRNAFPRGAEVCTA
jgi:hypothetical protein